MFPKKASGRGSKTVDSRSVGKNLKILKASGVMSVVYLVNIHCLGTIEILMLMQSIIIALQMEIIIRLVFPQEGFQWKAESKTTKTTCLLTTGAVWPHLMRTGKSLSRPDVERG